MSKKKSTETINVQTPDFTVKGYLLGLPKSLSPQEALEQATKDGVLTSIRYVYKVRCPPAAKRKKNVAAKKAKASNGASAAAPPDLSRHPQTAAPTARAVSPEAILALNVLRRKGLMTDDEAWGALVRASHGGGG
jgi:hypothetical protein